jgi:hypothetical protein
MMGLEPTTFCMARASGRSLLFAPVRSKQLLAGLRQSEGTRPNPNERRALLFLPRIQAPTRTRRGSLRRAHPPSPDRRARVAMKRRLQLTGACDALGLQRKKRAPRGLDPDARVFNLQATGWNDLILIGFGGTDRSSPHLPATATPVSSRRAWD